MLLLRERDTGHIDAADFGEIESKPAPAAADVEYALVGFDRQLGRHMALLGQLGVIERLFRALEIGAAILPVGVEEERVETPVEIVMMRHIAARTRARVELDQTPAQEA